MRQILLKSQSMASSRNYVLILLLIVSSLSSCDDKDSEDDFGTGSGIKGRVNVQNEFEQPLYDDRSGINIAFEVGYRDFDVVADNVGNWQLTGAPAGTYKITYSKAGYSTIVDRGVNLSYTFPKFPIDNQFQKIPSVTITKIPTTQFNDFELALNTTPVGQDTVYILNLSAVMLPAPPPTGHQKGYRIFIGKDENVSSANYLYQEYNSTTSANISQTYDNAWFTEMGIRSGDAIYAAIYGDASFNLEGEDDEGGITFPNIPVEPGAVSSVVLP